MSAYESEVDQIRTGDEFAYLSRISVCSYRIVSRINPSSQSYRLPRWRNIRLYTKKKEKKKKCSRRTVGNVIYIMREASLFRVTSRGEDTLLCISLDGRSIQIGLMTFTKLARTSGNVIKKKPHVTFDVAERYAHLRNKPRAKHILSFT